MVFSSSKQMGIKPLSLVHKDIIKSSERYLWKVLRKLQARQMLHWISSICSIYSADKCNIAYNSQIYFLLRDSQQLPIKINVTEFQTSETQKLSAFITYFTSIMIKDSSFHCPLLKGAKILQFAMQISK